MTTHIETLLEPFRTDGEPLAAALIESMSPGALLEYLLGEDQNDRRWEQIGLILQEIRILGWHIAFHTYGAPHKAYQTQVVTQHGSFVGASDEAQKAILKAVAKAVEAEINA